MLSMFTKYFQTCCIIPWLFLEREWIIAFSLYGWKMKNLVYFCANYVYLIVLTLIDWSIWSYENLPIKPLTVYTYVMAQGGVATISRFNYGPLAERRLVLHRSCYLKRKYPKRRSYDKQKPLYASISDQHALYQRSWEVYAEMVQMLKKH